MSATGKNTLIRSMGFIFLSLPLLFALSTPSLAAEAEYEIYMGKKYGPEYFFAISGEVYGQAAPGVEAVFVNNRPVPVDKDLRFRTQVTLAKGEKYLTIETRYEGLRFIKKYLVIRHPKVQKTFKVHIPEQEFKEIVKKKEVTLEAKKPAPPPPKKVPEVVKKPEKPKPEVAAPKVAEKPKPAPPPPPPPPVKEVKEPWMSRIRQFFNLIAQRFNQLVQRFRRVPPEEAVTLAEREAREIIRKEAVLIIERDAQRIIEGEAQKFVEREGPRIVQREARELLEEKYPEEELLKLLQREAPVILERKVEEIIARDVPTGEGLRLIREEIQKIVNREAPKVIALETRKIVEMKIPTAEVLRVIERKTVDVVEEMVKVFIDRDALWNFAKNVAEREALKAVDKEALRKIAQYTVEQEVRKLVEREAPGIIKAAAEKVELPPPKPPEKEPEVKRPEMPRVPKFVSVYDKWSGYDFVMELEPGKILLVKRMEGLYSGYLYTAKDRVWVPIQAITHQEFKELLETGKVPLSYDP